MTVENNWQTFLIGGDWKRLKLGQKRRMSLPSFFSFQDIKSLVVVNVDILDNFIAAVVVVAVVAFAAANVVVVIYSPEH